jgi:hypothetical protein
MIPEIIKQWEDNKHLLEEYFRTTPQSEYSSYYKIVTKLFELVITDYDEYSTFDISRMTVINDGDYQGTLIFIIPNDNYQPSVRDYVMTDTYYGSCSGCDTLQAISSYDDDLPNDEQVRDYMMLALHLVQKIKRLSSN